MALSANDPILNSSQGNSASGPQLDLTRFSADVLSHVQKSDTAALNASIAAFKSKNQNPSLLAHILYSIRDGKPGEFGEQLLTLAIRAADPGAMGVVETLLECFVHLLPAFPTGENSANNPDPLLLASQLGNAAAVERLISYYEKQDTHVVNQCIELAILQAGRSSGTSNEDTERNITILQTLAKSEIIAKRCVQSDASKTFGALITTEINGHKEKLSCDGASILVKKAEATFAGLLKSGGTTTKARVDSEIGSLNSSCLLGMTLPITIEDREEDVSLLAYAARKGLYSAENTDGVSAVALRALLEKSGIDATAVIQSENLIQLTADLTLKRELSAHCLKYLRVAGVGSSTSAKDHYRSFKKSHPYAHAGLHAFTRIGAVVGAVSFLAIAVMSTFEAWDFQGSHHKMHEAMKSLCELLCSSGVGSYEHGHKASFLAVSAVGLALTSAVIAGMSGAAASVHKQKPTPK